MENFDAARAMFRKRKVKGPFGMATLFSASMLINAALEIRKLEERRLRMKESKSVNCVILTVINPSVSGSGSGTGIGTGKVEAK